jgi:hypothetical protein
MTLNFPNIEQHIHPKVDKEVAANPSDKLGRYCIDKIIILEDIGNTRYLREMFNRKLNS